MLLSLRNIIVLVKYNFETACLVAITDSQCTLIVSKTSHSLSEMLCQFSQHIIDITEVGALQLW